MANVLVITDLEGVSGVLDMESVKNESSVGYQNAVKSLMEDTNTAVSALFDAGAKTVYVVDGHGSGKNFVKGALDKRAKQVYTWELGEIIASIDCFIMVGTHAMAKTPNAFFDHTQLWEEITGYYYNGERIGEIAQMGAFAGEYGIPCVFASGDEAACSEALRFYEGISLAPVKKALSRSEAIPYDNALSLIYEKAKEGFLNRKNVKPYKVEVPLTIKVEYASEDACDNDAKCVKEFKRLSPTAIEVYKDKIVDYFDVLIY